MGMAASQARFLNLTARKSNTEYQGQQVNQQRTVLANESASIFNQMAALTVPTPPIQTDYSKMGYAFSDMHNNSVVITDWKANPDTTSGYKYLAEVEYQEQIKNVNHLNTATFSSFDSTKNVLTLNGLSNPKYNVSAAQKNANLTEIINKYNATNNTNLTEADFVYLESQDGGASTTAKNAYYALATEVMGGASQQPVNLYSVSTEYASRIGQVPANFTTATAGGRFSQVDFGDLTDLNGNAVVDNMGLKGNHSLSLKNLFDEEAYDQAFQDYEYQKNIYEKTVQELNAKTEAIQQKDKTLELKLKQLDTEQEALTQEMEAVKAVIQKNVEKTFNTFA